MQEIIATFSYAKSELAIAARKLQQLSVGYNVLAFSGTLGAGKTTLIRELCNELGVMDHVSSPTFALINEYHYALDGAVGIIYHMDWYRLRDADEAINAGMEDCLNNKNALCLVEWPEQAPEILRSPYLFITIDQSGDEQRTLTIEQR